MSNIENKLTSLGYQKVERRLWLKEKKIIRVVNSSEYNRRSVRILWREEWKDYYAILYNYSSGDGPVCIVPVKDLFNSRFVIKKRKENSYLKNGHWWSQRFPSNHAFRQFILNYKNEWDLL